MPAPSKHRQAILQAAVAQFRRRGYAATGLADLIERSGAPKGSLYHYFPRGKAQIGEAAVRSAGETVRRTLEQIRAETPDAAALIREYVRRLAGWMEQSGWRDGCPITTTLLETAADEPAIRDAGREAFEGWRAVLADALMAERVGFDRASRLAAFAISALEGALVQARVERSPTPILAAGEELAALFRAAR
jgi:TetR/AcrR family transcriptional repressor of lmrAB and yxaGH operons